VWDICMMAWRIGEMLDIGAQPEWIREAGFDGVGFHASPGEPDEWQGIDPLASPPRASLRSAPTMALTGTHLVASAHIRS
jgi:hypothetical protein